MLMLVLMGILIKQESENFPLKKIYKVKKIINKKSDLAGQAVKKVRIKKIAVDASLQND